MTFQWPSLERIDFLQLGKSLDDLHAPQFRIDQKAVFVDFDRLAVDIDRSSC